MDVLLKSAVIIDPSSPHHNQKRDVLLSEGKIKEIGSSIAAADPIKVVDLDNLHISQGWFDSSVSFGEPGFEERETLENGLKTAALSGFTGIALNANSFPVSDSRGHIRYLKSKEAGKAVSIYPVGALTLGSEGKDLAELFDMKNEGAVSFYDYKKPIENPNLLKIALQYSQNFDALVQSFPFEKSVARYGVVNEELSATKLGLKGIPALSEELQIIRDLYILEYTGGRLHIPSISTKKSVQLIKEAKERGLNVSCSVAIFNVSLTDEALENFDTNYKILPPLRTQEDVDALIEGLKTGIIDGATSDHNPLDVEQKRVEFDRAMFGSIGLESSFGALNKVIGTEKTVRALTGLKKIFNIPSAPIKEGEIADLTLFNPEISYRFSIEDIISTSKNAAHLGAELKGKAYGIFANKKLKIHEDY